MPVPWRTAWQDALYGPEGFYRRAEGPAGHFTTSAHGPLGAMLAEAIARLADREGCSAVVDIGAGRGELLRHLADARPSLRLTGVDVVPRPPELPRRVAWLTSASGATLPDELHDLTETLVVANEWLDVVPCTVAEVDGDGTLRAVLVDAASGHESLGHPLDAADQAWADQWWPARTPGDRVEVGLARDLAWSSLVARISSGAALAIDYGHLTGSRPQTGSLTAYAAGRVTAPVPDGSCDLTAHLAVDSLQGDEWTTQRQALRDLGLTGHPPEHARATDDPAGYLEALSRSSAVAAMSDPDGFGSFHWVLARIPGAAPRSTSRPMTSFQRDFGPNGAAPTSLGGLWSS